MKRKNRTMLVIRRSGYYVNVIPNIPGLMQTWMENNLTRTNPGGKIRKDGLRSERSVKAAMKECCVTFSPVTAQEAEDAPIYVSALSRRFGLVE